MSDLTEHEAHQDYLAKRQEKVDSAVKTLLECQAYKGDTDGIECAIMRLPLDYEGALSIVKTLAAALWKRYEEGMYGPVEDDIRRLIKTLEGAEEPEPDPRWDEDQIADDPHRL